MIIVKSREEIELMRESALIVSKTLGMIASEIKEGVTTLYLDKLAEAFYSRPRCGTEFLGIVRFSEFVVYEPKFSGRTRYPEQQTARMWGCDFGGLRGFQKWISRGSRVLV